MLATVDLSRKYSSFIAPKNVIRINQENLQQKYGITATTLTAELAVGLVSKFSFTVEDLQAKWVNTAMFEPQKPVEIQMGYGNTLETVMVGEVMTVKTVFSSSAPTIEVYGEGKTISPAVPAPVFGLEYGKTLLDFTSTLTGANLRCAATCIGLPDIKSGVVLALTGLASRFNMNYIVEKAVHSWDGIYGYRTSFEGKALPRTVGVFRKNI